MNPQEIPLADFISAPRATRQRERGHSNASRIPNFELDLEGEDAEMGVVDDDDSGSAYEEDHGNPPVPNPASPSTTATDSKGKGSKRGRKPAPSSSRAARELARKTNHSKIEKRRREKMNQALAELRDLVPRSVVAPNDEEGELDLSKNSGEKAFKLEVLERTVVYVKDLLAKVAGLESELEGIKTNAGENLSDVDQAGTIEAKTDSSPSRKRRRTHVGAPPSPASTTSSPLIDSTSPMVSSTSPTFRPSSSTSPFLRPSRTSISFVLNPESQLPSPSYANDGQPPLQTSYKPLAPSTLVLPSPMHTVLKADRSSLSPPHSTSKTDKSWTPDEESAASLLMQISYDRTPVLAPLSSSSGSPSQITVGELVLSSPTSSSLPSISEPTLSSNTRGDVTTPFTPGSLLGL